MSLSLRCVAALSVFLLFVLATPVSAHHGWGCYGTEKEMTLSGIVTKVEWQNPHIRYFIDVKDEKSGKTTNVTVVFQGGPRAFETTYPSLAKDSFKVGDTWTASGLFQTNPSNKGTPITAAIPCGTVVFRRAPAR
jgi:hypothetical protein